MPLDCNISCNPKSKPHHYVRGRHWAGKAEVSLYCTHYAQHNLNAVSRATLDASAKFRNGYVVQPAIPKDAAVIVLKVSDFSGA